MSAILRGVGDPVQLEVVGAVLGPSNTKVKPETPAVVLLDPRDAYNVGNAQRACSNWGVNQLWWTGTRVTTDLQGGERLPREERMKGWANVALINHQRPFDAFKSLKPRVIGVELFKGAQNLFHYQHPLDAIYVFGPEDGSIHDSVKHLCHEFVMAPTHHCMNLAAAVNVVLAFRRLSLIQQGLEEEMPVNEYLREHRGVL